MGKIAKKGEFYGQRGDQYGKGGRGLWLTRGEQYGVWGEQYGEGEGNMAVIHKWKIPAISQQVRGIYEQGIQRLRGLKV